MILIVILVLLALGGAPIWPYSRGSNAGWYPSVGIVVVVILILVLLRVR
jgi:hypothetical protein